MTAQTVERESTTAPTWIAFQVLRVGFTLLPVLFGLDKLVLQFLNDWTIFLPGFVTDIVDGSVVMGIAGASEILIGIGVWLRPRIFGYLVAAWLTVIIVTLAIIGGFWSIALRDLGLLLAAVALGALAREHS